MAFKSIIGAVCAYLAVVSIDVCASIVSADWQTTGDDLITRDDISGLDWLDLTETNGMSRNFILSQLDSGGSYEGWRYASSTEVVTLWNNFGVDLSSSASTISVEYEPSVIIASDLLGNTVCEFDCVTFPYGALGLTSDINTLGLNVLMGAFHSLNYAGTAFYTSNGDQYRTDTYSSSSMGHYLVSASPVPVPAAVWLFGSGLLGLIGVARRKKG